MSSVEVDENEDRVYRPNMVYRSIRKQSSRTFCQIRKKLETFEGSVRDRNGMRPLENQDTPAKSAKSRHCTPMRERPGAISVENELAGYEFDEDSNLLKTPELPVSPWDMKLSGLDKLRHRLAITVPRKKKSRPAMEDSPSGSRLAKELARCKIAKIMSPGGRVTKKNTFIQKLNLVRRKMSGGSVTPKSSR